MSRLLKHLLHIPLVTRRAFPAAVQEGIRRAIHDGERSHRGEIRFVVEGDWPLAAVRAGKTVRERALEIFGLARVWDTADNTGILVYVLLCEHRVEILADRGLGDIIPASTWHGLCDQLTSAYRKGDFEQGSITVIRQMHELLARHFPHSGAKPNELPDLPVILR